jgi:hypothetical protein
MLLLGAAGAYVFGFLFFVLVAIGGTAAAAGGDS